MPSGVKSGDQSFVVRFGDDDSDDESGATNPGDTISGAICSWKVRIVYTMLSVTEFVSICQNGLWLKMHD